MKYARAKAVEVEALPGFKLRLAFADGAKGVFDCQPVLWGEMFEPLKDPALFAKGFLDYGAPTWPNGADLDPGMLRAGLAKTPRRSPVSKLKKVRATKSIALPRRSAAPTGVAEPPAPYGRPRDRVQRNKKA